MYETPVKLVIPRWGRTFLNVMGRVHAVSGDERVARVMEAVQDSKRYMSTDFGQAQTHLNELLQVGHQYIGLNQDNKRQDNPYRVGFISMGVDIDGVPITVQGDEPHNGISRIKLAEADIAVSGLDELLAMNYAYLDETNPIMQWGSYNASVVKDTDVRIAGSANLKTPEGNLDIVGFFLITHKQDRYKTIDELSEEQIPIFVKGRYEGAVNYALKHKGLNLMPVEDVEQAVASNPNSYGFEIVQSGSSLLRHDLVAVGNYSLCTESLFGVDKRKFINDERIHTVLKDLGMTQYLTGDRAKEFVMWHYRLTEKLGDNWVNKPEGLDELGPMFVGNELHRICIAVAEGGVRGFEGRRQRELLMDLPLGQSFPIREGGPMVHFPAPTKDNKLPIGQNG